MTIGEAIAFGLAGLFALVLISIAMAWGIVLPVIGMLYLLGCLT